MLQYTIPAAIVPSLFFMWFVRRRDANPEPARVVWTTFFLGVFATIPIAAIEHSLDRWMAPMMALESVHSRALFDAFASAAFVEESFKFAVLTKYCARHRAFDEPMDGIVYGCVASLGFATLENVAYVADGGMSVAVVRALSSVPSHAAWGAIMGFFLGRAIFDSPKSRIRRYFAAWFWPVLLHGLYDFPLMALSKTDDAAKSDSGVLISVTLAVIAIGFAWSLRMIRATALRQRRDVFAPIPDQPTTAPLRTKWTYLWAVIGGFFASGGAVMVLGVAVGMLINPPTGSEAGSLVLGTMIIGVAPFVVGTALFVRALKRIRSLPFKRIETRPIHDAP